MVVGKKINPLLAWEYVTDMRVAKAKALMAKKSMKLEEVAAKTGFCDASHLSRTLRAYKDAAESGATAR